MTRKIRNLVARHARTFNKSTIEVDRKKRSKNGYIKHRKPGPDRASSFKVSGSALSP